MIDLRSRKLLLSAFLLCVCVSGVAQQVFPAGKTLDKTLRELPEISENDILIIHNGYISSYNSKYLQPDWVAYELTEEELVSVVERNGSFKKDPAFSGQQATNGDYSKTGYDKGHIAPAADMKWSPEAMTESFYFSNICPQTPSLNRRHWLNLEKLARAAAQKYGKVWIISGAVVEAEHSVIGANKVAVPALFYKALLAQTGNGYISVAFLMKNNDENQPAAEAVMSVDELEALVGRNLFKNLPPKDTVAESSVCLSDWGLK